MEFDSDDISSEELSQKQSNYSGSEDDSEEFSQLEDDGDPLKAHIESKKAVVYIDHLLNLFDFCREDGCFSAIDPSNVKVIETGSAVSVKWTCNNHHTGLWHGSPHVGSGRSKIGVLNILLATCTLIGGLHITQVA